jgi:hypothetical protein
MCRVNCYSRSSGMLVNQQRPSLQTFELETRKCSNIFGKMTHPTHSATISLPQAKPYSAPRFDYVTITVHASYIYNSRAGRQYL